MKALLQTLIDKQSLPKPQMHEFMHAVMNGTIDDVMMGAILIALQCKGETPEEITEAARVMREVATPIQIDANHQVDIVGTGGDGQRTFNISTASAFVAASCGVSIVKHGNRSASSHCGSADLLEATGVHLSLTPEQLTECVNANNIGFLFAPLYHPALKNAKKVRSLLGVKTLFNLLGPLTNPAQTTRQVIGVYGRKWVNPIANALKLLGSEHAMVVHSEDGMDEISLFAPTHVSELKNGHITQYDIDPKAFGFDYAVNDTITANTIEESVKLFYDVLNNTNSCACAIVALNAAAAIYCSGLIQSYEEGIKKAQDAIRSGKALTCFEAYKQQTQDYVR